MVSGVALGLLLALSPSCDQPREQCDASTCPGCCDAQGQCRSGSEPLACGTPGGLCQTCSPTDTCQGGLCAPAVAGGGEGDGGEGPGNPALPDGGADPDAGTDEADGGVVEPDGGADAGVAYPDGPHGYEVGSVIPNLNLEGFARGTSGDRSVLQPLALSDFFNPSGLASYPSGSPYGEGVPLPRALVLVVSAAWSGPDQFYAGELDSRRQLYFPSGEFFLTLRDSPMPGTPPVKADLESWVDRHGIDYPAALDPARLVDVTAATGVDATPSSILIRTRDMRIVAAVAGIPNASFWGQVDAVLSE